MKTLHLYLTRQVLATLMMTVATFTFVLLLGNGLKEILELLIRRQATLGGVAEAFLLLIPFVLVFALPMGMLTAALLVFGRFSADQELTAVRSSGVSLITLVTPVLALSLVLCGVSAWINLEVAPHCRVVYKSLIDRMKVEVVTARLPEGRAIEAFKGYEIIVKKSEGQDLQGILVYCYDLDHTLTNITSAQYGRIETNGPLPVLHVYQLWALMRAAPDKQWQSGEYESVEFPLHIENKANIVEQKITDLTFGELRQELQRLENSFAVPDTGKLTSDEMRKQMETLRQQRADLTMPLRVQINRQIAVSFACFGFTLVGIPLGIRAHRRETNIGIAMALGLVFIYYGFIIVAQALQTRAEFAPYLIVWLPNFLFQTVGAVMLWRANRGI
jgi:lipopolysaccharide export system permease protein